MSFHAPRLFDIVSESEGNATALRMHIVHVPTPTLSPHADAVTVREGDESGVARIRLTFRTAEGSPRPAAPYSARLRTADGAGERGATAGADYESLDEVLTILPEDFPDELAAGESAWSVTRTIEIPIVEDDADEGGDETFELRFENDPRSVGLVEVVAAEGAACGPSPPCAVTVTVEDDDRAELDDVSLLDGDVVLTFSRDLDRDHGAPAPSAFTVTVNGAVVQVLEVTMSNRRVRLRLDLVGAGNNRRPVRDGDRVSVTYRPGEAGSEDNPPLVSDNGELDGHPAVFPEEAVVRAGDRARFAGVPAARDVPKGREGRLQLHLKRRDEPESYRRWGSVCDDRFLEPSDDGEPNQAAVVACRAIGYRTGVAIAAYGMDEIIPGTADANGDNGIPFKDMRHQPPRYRPGAGADFETIWLDDVLCYAGARGHPVDRPIRSLVHDCWNAGIGLHNCQHHTEDVFLRCEGGLELVSARLDPADAGMVALTFDDELPEVPSAAGFEVNAGDGWRQPTGSALDDDNERRLRLTLADPVPDGARVRVRYLGPSDDRTPLENYRKLAHAAFCIAFAASGAGAFGDCDGTAPGEVSTSGTTVTVTFDEELTAPGPASAFDVYLDGTRHTPTDAAVDGRTLTLTLATTVGEAEVAVAYRGADEMGLAGQYEDSPPFCVVLGSGGTTPCPAPMVEAVSAQTSGTTLEAVALRFNVPLVEAGPPDASSLPAVKLVRGTTHEGSVEIELGGRFGSVCDNGWDDNDARVVCRQLGHAGGTATTASHFGLLGGTHFNITNVGCDGTEAGLGLCNYEDYEPPPACHFSERAGVICEEVADLASAFTVEVVADGDAEPQAIAVESVRVPDGQSTVRVAVEDYDVAAGQSVTVRLRYADPTSDATDEPLQTAAHGVDAGGFCVEFVFDGSAGDMAWRRCGAPRVAAVRGEADDDDRATVTFDRFVDESNPAPARAFKVHFEGAAPATPTAARHDDDEVQLSFTNVEHPRGRPVQVAYADPSTGDDAEAVQSPQGADAASFCGEFRWPGEGPVHRCGPLLRTAEGATVTGGRAQVVLTFDRALAAGTPAGAFGVTADGVPLTVLGAAVADATVRLTLEGGAEVADGAALRVLYEDPSPGDDAALEGADGADAASLCVEFAWPGDGSFGRCPALQSWTLTSRPVPAAHRYEATVDLVFDTALDESVVPPDSSFELRRALLGTSVAVVLPPHSVTHLGAGVVRLVFLGGGEASLLAYRITYRDPTPADDADALQSADGVDAASLCLQTRESLAFDSCDDADTTTPPSSLPNNALTVTGTPRQAGLLTADFSQVTAALPDASDFTCRWFRVDSDGSSNRVHIELAGTLCTFYPGPDERGKRIRVEASFVAGSNRYTLESAATAAVGACALNSVGLVGDERMTPYEGHIELCIADGTGTRMGGVCDNGWNDAGAGVVCRQLGYAGGTATFASSFGLLGGTFYAWNSVNCTGTEAALHLCGHTFPPVPPDDPNEPVDPNAPQRCHFSERAGVQCAAPGAIKAAFREVPAAHDGASAFTLVVALSAPLDPGEANVAANVTAANGTVDAVARIAGHHDLWEVRVTPSGADPVTVRLAASPACGLSGAMCTADDRRVAAAATLIEGVPVTPTLTVPARHDGSAAFTVRVEFPVAVAVTDQPGAGSLAQAVQDAVTVEGGTMEGSPTGAAFAVEVTVTPAGDGPVTLRLAASPPCDAAGAICTEGGRRLAAGEATVPGPVKATFTVPVRDGSNPFTVRVALTSPLAGGADLRNLLTVTNGDIGTVARVDGRGDLWDVTVTPIDDAGVTLRLAQGPACGEPNAACTADGSRVRAAEKLVSGAPLATTLTAPEWHNGSDEFVVNISWSEGLAATTQEVEELKVVAVEAVTVVNGSKSVFNVSGDRLSVRVTPTGNEAVTVSWSASPPCDAPDAICTPFGRPVAAAEITVGGPLVPTFRGVQGLGVPGGHEGADTRLRLAIELSAPLAPATAGVPDRVEATNGTVEEVVRHDGRYDRWDAFVTPDGDDAVTVRLTAATGCDSGLTMCTAAGRPVGAAETTVAKGEFVTVTLAGPSSHAGGSEAVPGDEVTVTIDFSEALAAATANVADNLVVRGANVERVGRRGDSYASWDVGLRPTTNGPVEVTLAASPACTATGAMCTADSKLVPLRSHTVSGPRDVRVAATFTSVPGGHDGSTAFTMRLESARPLAAATADVAANLSATNATVTVAAEAGGDAWLLTLTPSANDAVTVTLSEGPPCVETGAMCTADGVRLGSASATVPSGADFVTVTFAGATDHGGGSESAPGEKITVWVLLSEALLASQSAVADNLTAESARIAAIERPSGRYDRWRVDLQPTTNEEVRLTLAASPNCDQDGAMCTAGGKLVPSSVYSIPGPDSPLRAAFTRVPGGHEGGNAETDFLLKIDFSAPLDSSTTDEDVLANLTSNGSSLNPTKLDGDSWDLTVSTSHVRFIDGDLTVTLAASPECGQDGAMCTADGRRLETGTSVTVPRGEFVTVTVSGATGHEGGSESDLGDETSVFLTFSEPLDASTANVADNVEVFGGRLKTVRLDSTLDEVTIGFNPTTQDTVAVRLRASPPCTHPGAMCTSDGKLVPRVLRQLARESSGSRGADAVSATFEGVPASHDGQSAFTVRIALSAALDKATADVAGSVTVAGGTKGAVARVDDRYDLWEVTATPSGTGAVTVSLAASPACDQPGAMCTKDGGRVAAAAATVPGPAPAFRVADAGADEGGGTLAFEVTLEPAAAADASVAYATADGTATAGEDYVAASGTLSFAAGETSKTVAVAVTDDAAEEGEETLTLVLSNAAGAALADAEATGTIRDDDAAEGPMLSVSDATGPEGGTATFEVTLAPAADGPVSAFYTTAGETAVSGVDFRETVGTLALAAGETSGTVAVELIDDTEAEGDETFRLELVFARGADYADPTGIGTIVDDDDGVAATFVDVPASHDGISQFAVGIELSAALDPSTANVAGNLTVAGGILIAEREGDGYDSWLVGVTPSGTGDVTVRLAASPECTAAGAMCTADGRRVTAAEFTVPGPVPPPALSVADATAAEGATASFAVTLDRAATAAVTVDYATADGTATVGEDYTAASGTLTFAAGEQSKTVAVATLDDTTAEFDETFTLTLSGASGATLADAAATGTIEDDESPSVRLHGAPAEHGGADQSFEARLDFSEEIDDISYEWVQDTLATAENGEVERAQRLAPPANLGWRLTVNPSSSADVTLNLTPGLTVPDGRPLRTGAPVTVRGPAPSESSVRGADLTLVWPEPRDTFGTPSGTDWAVAVNGTPRAVASAEIAGREALLVLSTPVAPADAVTVGYVGSAMHPLADETGAVRSAPWDGVAVGNATEVNPSGELVGDGLVPSRLELIETFNTGDHKGRPYEAHPEPANAFNTGDAPAGDGGGPNPSVGSRHDLVGDGLVPSRPSSTDAPAGEGGGPNPSVGSRHDLVGDGLVPSRLESAPADATRLDASGLGLTDLFPLAPFTSLERMDLSNNALADLTGIESHAALRELDLSNNAVADLGPLSALAALERLDLTANRITDIAPLAALPALKVLVLNANAISDLGPLTHLAALEHLSLANNATPDVTPLQDLPHLRRLDLGDNPIADLSPLGDVTTLEWLALPDEPTAAADALTRLTGLRWVWPVTRAGPAH